MALGILCGMGEQILTYDTRRVCGRFAATGAADCPIIAAGPRWGMGLVLLCGAAAAAVMGWLCFRLSHGEPTLWTGSAMLAGYAAAILLGANGIGQLLRSGRVELTPKRIVVGRGVAQWLRDEIAHVEAGVALGSLSLPVHSVNASLRNGTTVALLTGTREEVRFGAEVLRQALGIPADPFNAAHFGEISGPYVEVRLGACGIVADLRRRPGKWEALAAGITIGIAAGAVSLAWTSTFTAVTNAVWVGCLAGGLWMALYRILPWLEVAI